MSQSKDFVRYFHIAMVFVITFGFALIPPFGQITSYGMQVLGIFFGVLYGWIFCELFWPSVLALLALGMTDFGNITQVFTAGFGNSNVIMILVIFIFVGFLENTGLMRFIAEWFVSRRICEGRPYVLVIMLMIPAAIFGAFINVWAGLVIVWSLLFNACDVLGYKKDDAYVCMGVMVTTLAASVTPTIFTFRPIPIMANGWVTAATGSGYNQTTWLILQGLAAVLAVTLLILIFKFVVKPDVSSFSSSQALFDHLRDKKMEPQQKIALVFLAFFVVVLMIPLVFPKTMAVVAFINKFSIVGIAAVCLLFLSMVKVKGERVFNVQNAARTSVNWPLIFMLAASFPIGDALEQDATGIISTFTQFVTPLVSGLSPLVFMIVVIVVFNLMSQVMHNLVLMIVFTPVLCQLALAVGVPIDVFAPIFIFGVNTAMITPGSSATGAMLHGNTNWMSTKNTYKWAILTTCVIYLTLIVVVPIGMMMS